MCDNLVVILGREMEGIAKDAFGDLQRGRAVEIVRRREGGEATEELN